KLSLAVQYNLKLCFYPPLQVELVHSNLLHFRFGKPAREQAFQEYRVFEGFQKPEYPCINSCLPNSVILQFHRRLSLAPPDINQIAFCFLNLALPECTQPCFHTPAMKLDRVRNSTFCRLEALEFHCSNQMRTNRLPIAERF